jgi:hypothetical protein
MQCSTAPTLIKVSPSSCAFLSNTLSSYRDGITFMPDVVKIPVPKFS